MTEMARTVQPTSKPTTGLNVLKETLATRLALYCLIPPAAPRFSLDWLYLRRGFFISEIFLLPKTTQLLFHGLTSFSMTRCR